ncbi:MAG TPA: SUMF1/EgtB/PvdO family nonheme iron enzyme [Myxococcaceae bacterium]|jgi:hypothetical protein
MAAGCAARVAVAGGAVELDEARVEVEPFEVDEHLATVEEYRTCVEARGCEPVRSDDPLCAVQGDRVPIGCLRWVDAAAYCAWRSARLPTDAERSLLDRSAGGPPYRHLLCPSPGRENPWYLCDLGGPVETWTTNDALDGPSGRASSAPEARTPTLGARCARSISLARSTGVPKKLQTGVRVIQVRPPD